MGCDNIRTRQMLNERQTKLIADLQDAFGKMNGSTTAKGRLLDIQAIRNMMDESEAIKREVALYNEKMIDELHLEWTSQLEKLTEDLEELGLIVEFDEVGNSTKCYVEHIERDTETHETFTTNDIGSFNRFCITTEVEYSWHDLPNGERIKKAYGFRYTLDKVPYSTIEKLIESELFKWMLNQSLIKNNESKNI